MSRTNLFSIHAVYREEVLANGEKIKVIDHYDESTLDNDIVSLEWELSDPDAERHTVKDIYANLDHDTFDGKVVYAIHELPSDCECDTFTNTDGTTVRAWSKAGNADAVGDLMFYITKNSVYAAIATTIVKHIATILMKNDLLSACQAIVNAHFQDIIMNDIRNDLYLRLYDLASAGDMWLERDEDGENPHLVFADDDKGKSKYLDCYRSVRSTLTSYANHKAYNGVIVAIDAITENDNAMRFTHSEFIKNCAYDGSLEAVISRRDVHDFFDFVATKGTEEHLRRLKIVFGGLCYGFNNAEIATMQHLSLDQVKKARADLKKHYLEWRGPVSMHHVDAIYDANGRKRCPAYDYMVRSADSGVYVRRSTVSMLGNKTADDFATASSLVYKHTVSTNKGEKLVVTRLNPIKWAKNLDFNKPNKVLDWGMSHGKGAVRLTKVKKPSTKPIRSGNAYNISNQGTLSHDTIGKLSNDALWKVATAEFPSSHLIDLTFDGVNHVYLDENYDFEARKALEDKYPINVRALNPSIHEEYMRKCKETCDKIWVRCDNNAYKTLPQAKSETSTSGELKIGAVREMCEYREALSAQYPLDMRLNNPRIYELYSDLIKAKRRELKL